MEQVNSGTAYLLWCLCFIGVCGGQRFYTGKIASGLIYFFTVGFFGFGQLLDLVLIPGMVDQRNIYLRGLRGSDVLPTSNQTITVNVGGLQELQARQAPPAITGTPMQRLLKAARDNGGQLSFTQATMHTELEPQEVKQLLQAAEADGLVETINDPNTGAIRYRFDM
jgi:TM2 domain-containing membrane protein YozV